MQQGQHTHWIDSLSICLYHNEIHSSEHYVLWYSSVPYFVSNSHDVHLCTNTSHNRVALQCTSPLFCPSQISFAHHSSCSADPSAHTCKDASNVYPCEACPAAGVEGTRRDYEWGTLLKVYLGWVILSVLSKLLAKFVIHIPSIKILGGTTGKPMVFITDCVCACVCVRVEEGLIRTWEYAVESNVIRCYIAFPMWWFRARQR